MTKSFGLLAGALSVALLSSAAHASLSAFLTNTNGGGTQWDYTLRFTPSITGETLAAGDFVTIYDYANDISTASAAGWTGTQALLGVTPGALSGASGLTDAPSVDNVTFTYTGPTITTAQDFTAVITTLSAHPNTVVSDAAGQSSVTGSVTVPAGKYNTLFPVFVPVGAGATPEPASLGILSVAGLALLARRRRA